MDWMAFGRLFFLVIALGIDAFICSFSYGAQQIKIPWKSLLLINFITISLLTIGFVLATLFATVLPQFLVRFLPMTIFIVLGFSKVFESTIKRLIKNPERRRHFEFSLFNFGFVLQVYAAYELADVDKSKSLTPQEAVPLALALGIDGLSVGFSLGLLGVNFWLLIVMSLMTEVLCMVAGTQLGTRIAKNTTFDFSLLSGVILILLGIWQGV